MAFFTNNKYRKRSTAKLKPHERPGKCATYTDPQDASTPPPQPGTPSQALASGPDQTFINKYRRS